MSRLLFTLGLIFIAGCTQERDVPVNSFDIDNYGELTPEQRQARADEMLAGLVRKYALGAKKPHPNPEVDVISTPIDPSPPVIKKTETVKPLPKLEVLKKPIVKGPSPATTQTQKAPAKKILYSWPVQGPVVSAYGEQPDKTFNAGIDLAVGENKPIKAARAGEVMYAGEINDLLGFVVIVQHEDHHITAYANLTGCKVQRGHKVLRGQLIGYTAKHIFHFEIRIGEKSVNPLDYLPR